jgi:hypothetical protein
MYDHSINLRTFTLIVNKITWYHALLLHKCDKHDIHVSFENYEESLQNLDMDNLLTTM